MNWGDSDKEKEWAIYASKTNGEKKHSIGGGLSTNSTNKNYSNKEIETERVLWINFKIFDIRCSIAP